jgi:beta-glucosidase
MPFPANFVWGAATASYQIEGHPTADGAGPNVWDMFARRPGKTHGYESGAVACDHYHRYAEDARLLKQLGIPAYRFSFMWPRLLPEGVGQVNQAGVDFYDKLLDELLAQGVRPFATMFHWDYPYALYCRGGWLNPDSPKWFAEYAQLLVDKFSDRIEAWLTLNEPQCFIGLGLQNGLHAPGDKLGLREVLLAGHHSLLAHGEAVRILRADAKRDCEVGWAPVGVVRFPASEKEQDVVAAREAMFSADADVVWSNSWWNDPIFFGEYPKEVVERIGDDAPEAKPGEMELISQPLDFMGCNVYLGEYWQRGEDGKPEKKEYPQGIGRTPYGWPVTPEALRWGPKFFYERYKKPILVTENGLALSDWVHTDGKVHDPQRIDFLKRYLRAFEQAGEEGAELKGYFQWSLLDNYEWHEGYKMRFGLVYVDFENLERTPKDSAYWYGRVAQSNGQLIGED